MTVKVNVPAAVGVPAIRPPVVIGDNPVGSVPEVMVNVYDAAPPLAVIVWLKGLSTVPAGRIVGKSVMGGQGAGLMTRVYSRRPVQPFWSVAVTVKINVPAALGVPAIRPPAVIGDNPVGSVPEVMVNVYDAAPPLAVIVWLKGLSTVPAGRIVGKSVMGGQGAGLMTRVYSRKPVQPFWSVAVTVKINVPAALGVPAIRPPAVIGDNPVGSVPEVMVNVYDAAPPLAVIVWLKGLSTVPAGRIVGKSVMGGQGAGLMTRVYSRRPVQPFWSVAVTVKINVPAALGVPAIRPPAVIGDNPVGSVPEVMVNVYDAAPPLAVIVWLKGLSTVPAGRIVGKSVMGGQGAGLMTRVYSRRPVQPFWSVAVTVKINVPAALGVPAIRPPAVIGDNPVGSVPEVMVNVYDAAPPLAVIVWLKGLSTVPAGRIVGKSVMGGQKAWQVGRAIAFASVVTFPPNARTLPVKIEAFPIVTAAVPRILPTKAVFAPMVVAPTGAQYTSASQAPFIKSKLVLAPKVSAAPGLKM